MPDIIELLKADHQDVKALLKQLTAEEPPEDCDELFERLYTSVKTHAQFEEEEVYPLLKQDDETKDLALEAYEEHRQALTLLEDLHELDDEDETCDAKMSVLSENLNHHIKEEEGELLPELKKAVPAETLQRLGESYQQLKNEAEGAGGDEERNEAKPSTRPSSKPSSKSGAKPSSKPASGSSKSGSVRSR
jgi:hemerythrin superfamily protein